MTLITKPPTLTIDEPGFRMDSQTVRSARDAHWYAETEWGMAVLRYEDSTALLKHPKLTQGSAKWPAQHGVFAGQFNDWWRENLLVLEGADHHRIRRLVNPAFTPAKITPLHSRFHSLAAGLIDEWIGRGSVDFAEEFAAPYVTRVLCIMLGISEQEWKHIFDLASVIGLGLSVAIGKRIAEIDDATDELVAYAQSLVADRRQHPRDNDILTSLVDARDHHDKLTSSELTSIVVLLIFAGIDTTRNQLSLAIDSFAKQPDQWDKLAANPERYAGAAVEEVLRLNPIGRWITREASDTFEFKDRVITRGTTVHLFTLTSATDPEQFTAPGSIDLDAKRPPHFAFGGGIHHCLGHFVARADMAIALTELSRRLTNLSVAEGAAWLHDSGNTGAERLPITFSAR